MVRLKVRCCCTPTKVYGTLQVPEHTARPGNLVSVPVRGGPPLRMTVEKFGTFFRVTPEMIKYAMTSLFDEVLSTDELALRYEGDDVSFEDKLRRLLPIPEFEIDESLRTT